MIFAVVVAILAYRRAKENGRNPAVWALAAIATWIGTQLVVSAGAGVAAALGVELLGWSEDIYDNTMFTGPVTVLAIALSVLATWLLFRFFLTKPVDAEAIPVGSPEPPPPPVFRNDQ
jgi:hypothetical protein